MEIKNYNNEIPDNYYEVMSVLQDINGTLITLDGINNEEKIRFWAVDSICVTDEGSRIETYNNGKTKALSGYRLKISMVIHFLSQQLKLILPYG